jgi:heterodisulfide reductase subunit A-like polyferredoxin
VQNEEIEESIIIIDSKMKAAVAFSVCSAAIVLAQGQFDPASYASGDVITRDIAIIGGGSSGIYSAMHLQAAGKSVVVVEKEEVLGGHTHTWTDPNTGVSINYGVEAYQNSESLPVC